MVLEKIEIGINKILQETWFFFSFGHSVRNDSYIGIDCCVEWVAMWGWFLWEWIVMWGCMYVGMNCHMQEHCGSGLLWGGELSLPFGR